jgi:Flp pilus assembly protein CpaB
MNAWHFIIAAYAVTLAGTLGVTGWSYRTMRRTEARADALRNDR